MSRLEDDSTKDHSSSLSQKHPTKCQNDKREQDLGIGTEQSQQEITEEEMRLDKHCTIEVEKKKEEK